MSNTMIGILKTLYKVSKRVVLFYRKVCPTLCCSIVFKHFKSSSEGNYYLGTTYHPTRDKKRNSMCIFRVQLTILAFVAGGNTSGGVQARDGKF